MEQKIFKAKILVVEDEKSLRDVYMDALGAKGYEIISAENGKEGLEKAIKEAPDLILLDILMPVMDGFCMLKELRKIAGKVGKTPVIMLTNLSADSEDIVKKIADTEPVYYIVKASFSLKQLVDKIKEVLT